MKWQKVKFLVLSLSLWLGLAGVSSAQASNHQAPWGPLQGQVMRGEFAKALQNLPKVKDKKLKKAHKLKAREKELFFLKAVLLHKSGQSLAAENILQSLSQAPGPLKVDIQKYLKISRQSQKPPRQKSLSQLKQDFENYRKNKRWDLAVELWPDYENKTGFLKPSEIQEKAYDHFKARHYKKAASLFEKIQNNPKVNFTRQLQIRLSQAYARSDQFAKALAAYQKLRQDADKKQIPRWEYKIAYNYFDRGDYGKAAQAFRDFLKKHPKDKKIKQVRWLLAWAYYHQGQFHQARGIFQDLKKIKKRNPYYKSLAYWIARTYEKQGKKRSANKIYQSIAATKAKSYYAFLSLKRLQNIPSPSELPQGPWIQALQKKSKSKLPKLIKAPKEKSSRLSALYRLGLIEDFMEALGQSSKVKDWAQDYQSSLKEVWEKPQKGAAFQDYYPIIYAPWLQLFTALHDFPPELAWSIMRTESYYNTQALSRADARGLMQIIPPTAKSLAQQLAKENFHLEDLWTPAVSIELGVYYLSQNLRLFKGNLIHTIASYNAGEKAVGRWLKTRGHLEWDEFVESIPYQETRNYVKKVLRTYYIYKILYKEF